MKLLNGIDFSVIILYNVILIAVGMYLAKKKIKKASDFTTAGQSLGTFTVAGSIISTCMGASILFSNYQLIHAGGIRAAITSAFWYGAWLILVLLVGRVRKTGASSIPDYISKRFSPRAQKISAWAIVLVGLSTCAAQFKSIGAMAEALNICNPTTGIILRHVGFRCHQHDPVPVHSGGCRSGYPAHCFPCSRGALHRHGKH